MSNKGEKHIEISVELAYDHRDGEDDNLLIINNGNHHHTFGKIEDTHHAHTITWTLTGNASSGEFCALDDADNPGFLWLVRTPSEHVFHKLQLLGRNKLTIHNHHHDKSSEGIWHYQLFARFGNKVFGVPLTFCCGSTAMSSPNPSIKNT
jgi:hypothetical protein